MPLVYAAVVPHAPVLAPTLAPEHHTLVQPTLTALHHVGQSMRAVQPDLVIVLTPHAAGDNGKIVLSSGERLVVDLSAFGDLRTNTELPSATVFAQFVRAQADRDHVPTALQGDVRLDYGVSVPWLAGAWPTLPCLPVAVFGQSDELLYRFGELLAEVIHQRPERVVVIASADLAERPDQPSEADRPLPWERDVAAALRTGQRDQLPAPSDDDPCGRAPIVTLLSVLSAMKPEGTILSFQSPFRVGYLVAELHLHR